MISSTPNFGKIVVVSDLHYGLGRNSKTKLRILKEYVEPEILKELKADPCATTLVICGDLFHEMVSVRTDIYKEARSFLTKCSEEAKVILIAGNHDCFDDNTDVTSVELFDQIVDVVRYPREGTESEFYGLKCLLLPWSDNNETAFKFDEGKYDCVFCHPDVPKEFFTGLYILENSKRISASERNQKLINDDKLLRSGLEGINFSDGSENIKAVSGLESVRKLITLAKNGGDIYAGHIHKHSESRILGRTFRFIGSPYQTTSEEMNTKSGFYIITKDSVEFKEIHAPEYVKVKFSDIKRLGIDNYDFSKIHNNIVQFDGDDIISVELEAKLKKKILDEKPFEISDTDYSNLVMESDKVENVEEYQKAFSTSPKHCVSLYIENIPDEVFKVEGVDKKHIMSTFDKLYDFIDKKNGSVVSEGGAHVNYKKLVATNFLSYETLEFEFEKYNGLTLIYGRNLDNIGATNACGKSNIIKAISYALFGRFPKKVKKENILPWEESGKDVNVTLVLESNGVNYRIESGFKRGRDSYHRIFNLDTDTEITKKQIAETRKFIENEILHCGFDMFMKTTILTSSEIFNFYCMKKEDKDDYLNTIFGTKTLNEVREQIKGYLKDNRVVYLENSRLLDSKSHDIELNKSASERFEETRRKNIESINAEIKDIEVQIIELNEAADSSKSELTRELEKKLDELNAKIKTLNIEIQRRRVSATTLSRSIEKDSTTINLMRNELSKHKDVVPKLCESCKKIVADGYNLSEYAKTIKTAKKNIEKNRSEFDGVDSEIKKLEDERDALVADSMRLNGEIRESRGNSAQISKMETLIESKKSTLEFIKNQVNPNIKIIETLEADKKELNEKVEEILSKIRHLDFIQTKVVSQEVITNLLTSRFIQQLNERIRYYLQRLGLNLGVEFDNEFHYEFIRGNGAHPEFNSLSGGESLRIVIATSFAFKDFLESRRNISSNIRFLDEFFEKDTDNLGMNSTIAILKDFSKIMNQNVFLISNKLNEIDDSVFDNTLVVTIKNSKSSVSEEKTADVG